MIEKIISGGQTGVDQSALDVAISLGLQHGGWCPKGHLSENGVIPPKYLLTETESADPSIRTKLNIRDSDGTLVLVSGPLSKITDGTILTIQEAQEKNNPFLLIDLSEHVNTDVFSNWITDNHIKVLNIAGPRESQSPGIYEQSTLFLKKVIFGTINNNSKNTSNCSLWRLNC